MNFYRKKTGRKFFLQLMKMRNSKTKRESYPVKDCDIKFIFHNDGKKHITFTSKGYVVLAIPCNKCLEPVDYKINIDSFKDLDLNKTSEQRIADLDETNYLTVQRLIQRYLLITRFWLISYESSLQ